MKSVLLQWGKVLAAMVAVTAILLLVLSYIFYKRTFKTKVKSEINNIKTNINN